jgi:hypothetical protein
MPGMDISTRSRFFRKITLRAGTVLAFCNLLRVTPGCTFVEHVRSVHAVRHQHHPDDHVYNDIAFVSSTCGSAARSARAHSTAPDLSRPSQTLLDSLSVLTSTPHLLAYRPLRLYPSFPPCNNSASGLPAASYRIPSQRGSSAGGALYTSVGTRLARFSRGSAGANGDAAAWSKPRHLNIDMSFLEGMYHLPTLKLTSISHCTPTFATRFPSLRSVIIK